MPPLERPVPLLRGPRVPARRSRHGRVDFACSGRAHGMAPSRVRTFTVFKLPKTGYFSDFRRQSSTSSPALCWPENFSRFVHWVEFYAGTRAGAGAGAGAFRILFTFQILEGNPVQYVLFTQIFSILLITSTIAGHKIQFSPTARSAP